MEISTLRQLLRSLGPLPETSARTPQTSEKFLQSGFRKRGRRNGVASDFSAFFRFLPFFLLFPFLRFFPVSIFVLFCCFFFGFRFFPLFCPFSSVSFCFLPLHYQKKTGRHRSQDPFCETPIQELFQSQGWLEDCLIFSTDFEAILVAMSLALYDFESLLVIPICNLGI